MSSRFRKWSDPNKISPKKKFNHRWKTDPRYIKSECVDHFAANGYEALRKYTGYINAGDQDTPQFKAEEKMLRAQSK